jgi:hypothetical protein
MSVKESFQYSTENFFCSSSGELDNNDEYKEDMDNNKQKSSKETKGKTKNYCGSKINCHCILV